MPLLLYVIVGDAVYEFLVFVLWSLILLFTLLFHSAHIHPEYIRSYTYVCTRFLCVVLSFRRVSPHQEEFDMLTMLVKVKNINDMRLSRN